MNHVKKVIEIVDKLREKYPGSPFGDLLLAAAQIHQSTLFAQAFVLTEKDEIPTALEALVISLGYTDVDKDSTNIKSEITFLAETLERTNQAIQNIEQVKE